MVLEPAAEGVLFQAIIVRKKQALTITIELFSRNCLLNIPLYRDGDRVSEAY